MPPRNGMNESVAVQSYEKESNGTSGFLHMPTHHKERSKDLDGKEKETSALSPKLSLLCLAIAASVAVGLKNGSFCFIPTYIPQVKAISNANKHADPNRESRTSAVPKDSLQLLFPFSKDNKHVYFLSLYSGEYNM